MIGNSYGTFQASVGFGYSGNAPVNPALGIACQALLGSLAGEGLPLPFPQMMMSNYANAYSTAFLMGMQMAMTMQRMQAMQGQRAAMNPQLGFCPPFAQEAPPQEMPFSPPPTPPWQPGPALPHGHSPALGHEPVLPHSPVLPHEQGAALPHEQGAALPHEQGAKEDGNVLGDWKYANPLYYAGRATELAGKGAKWVGEELTSGADFLDEHSKELPGVLKAPAGVVSGALGFVGGATEGVGGMAEYAGKLGQGDRKTIHSTVDAAKHVGEGVAYLDGKLKEGTGNLISSAGSAVHSDTLKAAGDGFRHLGQAEQGLAGEGTRNFLDTLGTSAQHYGAALETSGWKAAGKVGEWTGSEKLESAAKKGVSQGEVQQQLTSTGMTRAIDQVVDERLQEYKENGSYAVSRDLTRVVGEIGTAVLAPEMMAGKVGMAEKVGDAARLSKPLKLQELQPQYVGEHLPGNDVWETPVKYLEGAEREAHKLTIKDGKLYNASGELFDTSKAKTAFSGGGKAIFTMDENGGIYASMEQKIGHFHHSSLAGGKPVAAAGELEVVDGKLQMISNRSGHYRPSQELTDQALDVMRERGLGIGDVRVEGF